MAKNPAFQFYPGDWTRDLDDQDLEIEGAWIRICCRLWWSDTPGEMTKTIKEWSRILRKTEKKTTKIFQILIEKGIASGSILDNQNITVISRRMVKDFRISQIRRASGRMGGNPDLKKNMKNLVKQSSNQNPTPSSSSSYTPVYNIYQGNLYGTGDDFAAQKFYFSQLPGVKTIQTFDDEGRRKNMARIFHFENELPEESYKLLLEMNKRGAGVYCTVNETDGKGRKSENVKRIRAIFVDMDGAPLSLPAMYSPSMTVESSPGRYHCYWLTDDVPVNAFAHMQKTLIQRFNSDKAIHDLPRVLRVPGFYHMKREPFLTRIISSNGIVYKYRELVEMFPPVMPKAEKVYPLQKPAASAEYRGDYGAQEGDRNCHVMRRIGGMIKRNCSWDYIESEALREGRLCVPPLEESEVMGILKSARKYQ